MDTGSSSINRRPKGLKTVPATHKLASLTHLRKTLKLSTQANATQPSSQPKNNREVLKIRILKRPSNTLVQSPVKSPRSQELDCQRKALQELMESDTGLAATLRPIQAAYEEYICKQAKQLETLKGKLSHDRSMEALQLGHEVDELVKDNASLQRTLQQLEQSKRSRKALEEALQAEQLKKTELEDMITTLEQLGISAKEVCAKRKRCDQAETRTSRRSLIARKLPLS